MPAITTAVLGAGIGIASAGMSFAQAAKQNKAAEAARDEAAKAFAEAKKALDVNYYKGLSIQKEPYELEREALAQSGAQAMEAARETDRGVAATAGRVQMAQNVGQRQIAGAMGQELQNLEMLTAQEESRLRDAKAQLELERAAGAQEAAAQAKQASAQAMSSGMTGLMAGVQSGAEAIPLYMKGQGARNAKNTLTTFDELSKGGKLAPQYAGQSINQILASQEPNAEMQKQLLAYTPLQVQDYLAAKPKDWFEKFNSGLTGTKIGGYSYGPSVSNPLNINVPSVGGGVIYP
jgi:hypothetical protein